MIPPPSADGRPLRVLMTLHMVAQPELGAAQPQLALAEEFRALGSEVEIFDMRAAFPRLSRSRHTYLLPMREWFARGACRFLRREGRRFDVVDALQGDIPRPKAALGYRGLLVARSVGMDAPYAEFDRRLRARLPPARGLARLKNFARERLMRTVRTGPVPLVAQSFAAADLVNVPIPDEREWVRRHYRLDTPCLVQPFGLTPARHRALADAAAPDSVRAAAPVVAFVGSWDERKGSAEWPEILRRVRGEVPAARFRFLGAIQTRADVCRGLGVPETAEHVEVVSRFPAAELPARLGDATLGAFPSHLEGFGIAVIEMMAARLPVVAFNAPGASTTLAAFAKELLVPAGDAASFAARIVALLRAAPRRAALGEACRQAAGDYSWPRIARETLAAYREALARLPRA